MSSISAGTTSSTALVATADTSGALELKTNNGTTALTLDTSQNATFAGYANLPNTFGFKNRIINGAMVIDQRNAGASVTATADTYCVDRWAVGFGTTVNAFTAQQSTTVPAGFKNSLLLTAGTGASAGAGGYAYLRQMVEGLNVYDLGWGTASAATITVSFWVRSSLTGTFGFVLRNSAGDRAYGATFSISSANTFEYKTVTIPGDTSGTWLTTNGIGIGMFFDLGAGTNYAVTAGSWQTFSNALGVAGTTKLTATTGATMYITGVQLEKGSTATSFDYRPYGTELALCQRYYWPLRGTAATPSFLARNNAGGGGQGPGLSLKFPQSMRAAPTATQVGSWTTTNTSGGGGPTSPSCFTTDYVTFYVDSAAAGDCYYYLNGTANGFNFSSEL